MPTYNKFFLCDPSDIPYQTDDIRQEDVEMRQRFHDAFISFFQETGIPYELLSGTQEERIKRVEQILQEA